MSARKVRQPQHRPGEARRVPTGRLVPCPGEAHSNAFIDHCAVCAPRWGQVEEYAPIDIKAAREAGLDVPWSALTTAQSEYLLALEDACELVTVGVEWRGCSYQVARFVGPEAEALREMRDMTRELMAGA